MTIVFGPLSGRLVGARGARAPLLAGGAGIALGSVLLTGLRADTPLVLLVVAYSLFGFGFALVNPPITNTAVTGMPPEQAGVAAAIASTSRQVGASIGVAVVGAPGMSSLAGSHHGAALASDTHPGWWVATLGGVVVLLVGGLSTTRRALATAERAAARLEEPSSLCRRTPRPGLSV
jgi:MFS family permease